MSGPKYWPDVFPNVWLGVTAENQQRADERIPILLQIPAAVRFVSVEPMLGPVDLTQIDIGGNVWINSLTGDCKSYHPYGGMWKINESKNKLDWVICGGETGPGARPMHPEWARSLRDQCQAAGTPFFFKQWGKYISISQMPEDTYRAWDIHHGTEVGWEHDKPVWKVGKKFAGRLLDGREHNEYPEVTHERET
jgi:protein gp37